MAAHEVAMALHAMATRFELLMHGREPVPLRSAGEEALAEIARIEDALSLYRPHSEIAHVNARAAREPVRVSPPVFELLRQAQTFWLETRGTFDVTIAPLVRCWGFMGGTGRLPAESEIEQALACTGMNLVTLDPAEYTVRFERPGVMLDLGAIGKGWAIDRAVEILREAEVQSAILHGGTSTCFAIGTMPDGAPWTLLLEYRDGAVDARGERSCKAALREASLSVSGIWGRAFEHEGRVLGHVLDPASGRPVSRACMAAVVLPTATATDALSTALLVGGASELKRFASAYPEGKALLVATPQKNTSLKHISTVSETAHRWQVLDSQMLERH